MTFDARWGDFDATRVPDPPWTHVWALTARVLVTGGDLQEVESYLWRWRWSGWILALNEDANTCQVCGARMEGAADPSVRSVGRPRLNCTNVCRQQRNRLRAKALPTPWEERVAEASLLRTQLDAVAVAATRRMVLHRLLHPSTVIVPPNWAAMRHAPILPARCAQACDAAKSCQHTGGLCLFAAVGRTE
jgi:hypothetical protein